MACKDKSVDQCLEDKWLSKYAMYYEMYQGIYYEEYLLKLKTGKFFSVIFRYSVKFLKKKTLL